jgi:23S rRNA (pseudouridine1915-N3)-methyltransferase
MLITIIAAGKLKERFWQEAYQEYAKRMSAFAELRLAEIPDRDPARLGAQRAMAEEGEQMLKAVPKGAYVIALSISGKQRSSEGLSLHIEELKTRGQSHFCFVIGASHGLSPEVLDRADEELSFGPITLPHNLARIVLIEQLYRAACIRAGRPYHK